MKIGLMVVKRSITTIKFNLMVVIDLFLCAKKRFSFLFQRLLFFIIYQKIKYL